jgi:hypothetical protein
VRSPVATQIEHHLVDGNHGFPTLAQQPHPFDLSPRYQGAIDKGCHHGGTMKPDCSPNLENDS